MARINIKDLQPVSATHAKVRFGELLHRASVDNETFVVNRQNRPVAVILSYRRYQELCKTEKA